MSVGDLRITYEVDASDVIVRVSEQWDRFALDNAAPDVTAEAVLKRSLWDFVCDESTRHLYAHFMARARQGDLVQVPFRCDGPSLRRFLNMSLKGLDGGGVEFRTELIRTEPRPEQPLLKRITSHDDRLIRMCSWCKRIMCDEAWVPVEQAVVRLHLYDQEKLPAITHGMCDDCYKQLSW